MQVAPAMNALPLPLVKGALTGAEVTEVMGTGSGVEEQGQFASLVPIPEPAGEEIAAPDSPAALPERVEGLPWPVVSMVWTSGLPLSPIVAMATAAPPAGEGRDLPDAAKGPAADPVLQPEAAAGQETPARDGLSQGLLAAVAAPVVPPPVVAWPGRASRGADSSGPVGHPAVLVEQDSPGTPLAPGLLTGQPAVPARLASAHDRPPADVDGVRNADAGDAPGLNPGAGLAPVALAPTTWAPPVPSALAESGARQASGDLPAEPVFPAPSTPAVADQSPMGQSDPEPGLPVPPAGASPERPLPGKRPAPPSDRWTVAEVPPHPSIAPSAAERLWLGTYQQLTVPVGGAKPSTEVPIAMSLAVAESGADHGLTYPATRLNSGLADLVTASHKAPAPAAGEPADPRETGGEPARAALVPTQGSAPTASPPLAPAPIGVAGSPPSATDLTDAVLAAAPGVESEAAVLPALSLASLPTQGPGPAAPVAALAQVAPALAALVHNLGDGSTEIALAPEELGKVRLHLQPDGQNPERLVVVLMFERAETMDLFRKHAADLSETLRAAGYGDARLEFGQSGPGSGGGLGQGIAPGRQDGDAAPEPDRLLAGLPERVSLAQYREPGSLDIRL